MNDKMDRTRALISSSVRCSGTAELFGSALMISGIVVRGNELRGPRGSIPEGLGTRDGRGAGRRDAAEMEVVGAKEGLAEDLEGIVGDTVVGPATVLTWFTTGLFWMFFVRTAKLRVIELNEGERSCRGFRSTYFSVLRVSWRNFVPGAKLQINSPMELPPKAS